MSQAILQKLSQERDQLLSMVTQYGDTAVREERDLNTSELETITRSKDRVGDIDAQIEVMARESQISESAQATLKRMAAGGFSSDSGAAVEYRSAAHYVKDLLFSRKGHGRDQEEAKDRLAQYHRAVAHITTGDLDGSVPTAIVGPVQNFIDKSRPLITALGARPVPPGNGTFLRPRLVDPNVATGVGVQSAQKTELASASFEVTNSTVTLQTVGGYVNVAKQVVDWNVASLQLIVDQLAARYAIAAEKAAIAELAAGTEESLSLESNATLAQVTQAVFDAAAEYYGSIGEMPTILAVGPAGWARLGGLADTTGRSGFPFLNPANAGGSMSAGSFAGNPVGLNMVVTPGITGTDMWVLSPAALEVYEQESGSLQVAEPSVWGIQVGYAGYLGFSKPPVPTAAGPAIHIQDTTV